jgi:hypothetical protein
MWAAAAAVVVVAVAVVIVLRTLFNHSSYLIMISLWALLTIVGRRGSSLHPNNNERGSSLEPLHYNNNEVK